MHWEKRTSGDNGVRGAAGAHNRRMHVAAVPLGRPLPIDSALTAWSAREFAVERPRVAIPRAQVQLVVRFGPAARDGLDIHVLGAQQTVRRKVVRGVHRSLVARCGLGSCAQVFGVPASELAGRIAPLESLWGDAATHALRERLAQAGDVAQATALLDDAVARRIDAAVPCDGRMRVVAEAARQLPNASVRAVADGLGLSERHLRRLFQQAVGMSPKRFERIARFDRAIRAARENAGATWASIAAATGYYDQAHLIDDFRAIAGATPGAFLRELDETS